MKQPSPAVFYPHPSVAMGERHRKADVLLMLSIAPLMSLARVAAVCDAEWPRADEHQQGRAVVADLADACSKMLVTAEVRGTIHDTSA